LKKAKEFNLKKLLFVFIPLFLLTGYTPDPEAHIRFGAPAGSGRILKKTGYVLMYGGSKKNPLWVSYHLKKGYIPQKELKNGTFKQDKSLPPELRTKRGDYPAKYDRCPMAPAVDLSYSDKTFGEAFVMSNFCPMEPWLKRGLWKEAEAKVRNFAQSQGGAFVVTGPVFDYKKGAKKTIGQSGIYVPTHFYKALLYQSADGGMHAFGLIMENKKPDKKLSAYSVSVDEIEKISGFDFFAELPAQVQDIIEKEKGFPAGF